MVGAVGLGAVRNVPFSQIRISPEEPKAGNVVTIKLDTERSIENDQLGDESAASIRIDQAYQSAHQQEQKLPQWTFQNLCAFYSPTMYFIPTGESVVVVVLLDNNNMVGGWMDDGVVGLWERAGRGCRT